MLKHFQGNKETSSAFYFDSKHTIMTVLNSSFLFIKMLLPSAYKI